MSNLLCILEMQGVRHELPIYILPTIYLYCIEVKTAHYTPPLGHYILGGGGGE